MASIHSAQYCKYAVVKTWTYHNVETKDLQNVIAAGGTVIKKGFLLNWTTALCFDGFHL